MVGLMHLNLFSSSLLAVYLKVLACPIIRFHCGDFHKFQRTRRHEVIKIASLSLLHSYVYNIRSTSTYIRSTSQHSPLPWEELWQFDGGGGGTVGVRDCHCITHCNACISLNIIVINLLLINYCNFWRRTNLKLGGEFAPIRTACNTLTVADIWPAQISLEGLDVCM